MNDTGRGIAVGAGLLAAVAVTCADEANMILRIVVLVLIALTLIALTTSICNQADAEVTLKMKLLEPKNPRLEDDE